MYRSLWLSGMLVSLAACTPVSQPQAPVEATSETGQGPVRNYATLVEHLRASGRRVEDAGEISQPFFTPKARVATVDGDDMQVYEYANAETAAAEASRVSSNGASVGTRAMAWIAPPHFFHRGRLLVVYLGSSENVLHALRGILGPQFAGASRAG